MIDVDQVLGFAGGMCCKEQDTAVSPLPVPAIKPNDLVQKVQLFPQLLEMGCSFLWKFPEIRSMHWVYPISRAQWMIGCRP